jgi:hypothetical protein
MPDDERPGEAAIENQLRQARQALADADGARDAELSDAVVINRLYYACFHVAQAVLYDPTPTAAFVPASARKSSSLVTHPARTAAS